MTNKYRVELAPTLTGHYYFVYEGEKKLGVFPSSTTILNAYPQSQHLTRWIADHGMEEAERIRDDAGSSGTKIHEACDLLEAGQILQRTFYSLKEWNKINAFVNWWKEYRPETIASEIAVFSKKGKYAGRVDRIYKIEDKTIVLDFKSSSALHPHFPLQFASYAHAIEENSDLRIDATAALLLGASNKNGYRFELYENWKDHYKVFQKVRGVWEYDNYGSKKTKKEPPVLILPETLTLK